MAMDVRTTPKLFGIENGLYKVTPDFRYFWNQLQFPAEFWG